MVGGTNGCEGVNIVILRVVHLSKFGCLFIGGWVSGWCGFFFLCCSLHAQSNCRLSLTVVLSSGPAP